MFQISKMQTLAGCGTFEGNQMVVELVGNRKIGAVVVV